jgi:hypothetical protein
MKKTVNKTLICKLFFLAIMRGGAGGGVEEEAAGREYSFKLKL